VFGGKFWVPPRTSLILWTTPSECFSSPIFLTLLLHDIVIVGFYCFQPSYPRSPNLDPSVPLTFTPLLQIFSSHSHKRDASVCPSVTLPPPPHSQDFFFDQFPPYLINRRSAFLSIFYHNPFFLFVLCSLPHTQNVTTFFSSFPFWVRNPSRDCFSDVMSA